MSLMENLALKIKSVSYTHLDVYKRQVVGGALGAGYYFKIVKKKEDKELEALEEEDDDFFSEAESEEEINDADEVEDEE